MIVITEDAGLTGALARHSDAAFAAGATFALATAFQAYLSGPAPTLAPAVPVTLLWGDAGLVTAPGNSETRSPGTGFHAEQVRR
ncbi:hypothetical protein ND748_03340 [Frankia sp. AiPs1]|uniref:hypothetical protein n=1 Tax=Frankia sp. AiPs1 TaxID=573493 RepID=UPI002044B894|nr:hypothetical protein [Frankia sp. AiPs1]MCM3920710.1 hypothetical protein [Frankia sp. AiPs1]